MAEHQNGYEDVTNFNKFRVFIMWCGSKGSKTLRILVTFVLVVTLYNCVSVLQVHMANTCTYIHSWPTNTCHADTPKKIPGEPVQNGL